MTILNLKKRIPEPEEEMEGSEEAENYFSIRRGKGGSSYQIVSLDILNNIKLIKGKVLDIGCGYGGLIKELSIHEPKLSFVGLDLSKSMLKIGKKYCKNVNVKFYQKPADRSSFKKNSFDLVVCKDTFHHFSKPVKVLKEMLRIVKKGGHIYIIDLKRDCPKKIVLQTIQEVAERNVNHSIQYYDSIKAAHTISEMKKLFKKSNIKKYKIKTLNVNKNFIKKYRINSDYYLKAKNFVKGRWVAIIKK